MSQMILQYIYIIDYLSLFSFYVYGFSCLTYSVPFRLIPSRFVLSHFRLVEDNEFGLPTISINIYRLVYRVYIVVYVYVAASAHAWECECVCVGCVCICRYSLLWVLSTSINSLKFLIVYTFISGLGGEGENRDGERGKQNSKRGSYFCCSL